MLRNVLLKDRLSHRLRGTGRGLLLAITTSACLFVSINTFACSCMDLTLAQQYQRAAAIVVALKRECAEETPDPKGECPNDEWYFDIVEILKDPASQFVDRRAKFKGDMLCDMSFQHGYEFLFFVTEDGDTSPCMGSRYLGIGDQAEAERSQDRLEILRGYRDGGIASLSEPWTFDARNSLCHLNHLFAGGHFSISYTTQANLDRAGEVEVQIQGLEPKTGRPELAINFTPGDIDVLPGSVSINIDGKRWQLARRTMTVKLDLSSKPYSVTSEILSGQPALDLLSMLEQKRVFEISAETGRLKQLGSSPEPIKPVPISYSINTSGIEQALARFKQCMSPE